MKKTLSALFCLLLVMAMVLTACGGGGATSEPSGSGENSGGDDVGTTTTTNAYLDDDTSSDPPGGGGDTATGNTDGTTTGAGNDGPLKTTNTTTGGGNKTQSTGGGATKTTASGGKYDPYAGITADMKGKTVRILIVNGPGADDEALGDAFKKEYGIRYRFVGVPLPMYKTKLTAMVASEDSPDLAVMTVAGTGDYPAMILNGQVQPLPSGVFDLERDTELDTFQMEWTSWGGKIYGVQLKNSTEYQRGCIMYNKALFQARGVKTPYELFKEGNWNRETFAETMKKMTYTEGTEKIYGFAASDTLNAMLAANQTDFVKKNGDKFVNNVTDNKVVSLLQWASDLREKGYWSADSNGASGLFQAGKAAMLGENSWYFADLTGVAAAIGKNNLEVVPTPGNKGEYVQAVDASVWCVPVGAQNAKEACYFARYWLDANNQDLSKYYSNKQQVEMHNIMSYAEKKYSSVSTGVCGYDDVTKHSELTYAWSLPVNDIPVFLQEKVSMVDGLINRINGKKAPN